MLEFLCHQCGRSYPRYNSLQTKCGLCLYNTLEKPRKPLKRVGPVTKKWIAHRQQWIEAHPGPYTCYLCGVVLTVNTLTLDHVLPRSRRPDLRLDDTNIQPCCYYCNHQKGSKVYAKAH